MLGMTALLIFASGIVVGWIVASVWTAAATLSAAREQAQSIMDEARSDAKLLIAMARQQAKDIVDMTVEGVQEIMKRGQGG
jgi:uncharacterized membrane protein SpoIIM required for sporulation